MENVIYLEKEDILDAHMSGFTEYGGTTYAVNESCIENRVVEPQTIYWGAEQYPGLFKKAAVYMHRITTSHCFADGNKRAAVIATDLFLKFNGYKISASQKDLYDYCLLIGNHETRPNLEEVEEWLQLHSQPYTIDLEELSDFI